MLSANTSVVTLPIDWCRKNSLKKGDTLEVEPRKNELIIKNSSTHHLRDVEFDLSKISSDDKVTLNKLIFLMISYDFDEIILRNVTPDSFFNLEKTINILNSGYMIDSVVQDGDRSKKLSTVVIKKFFVEKFRMPVSISLLLGFSITCVWKP